MKVLKMTRIVTILLSILALFSVKLVHAQTNWKEMLEYYKSNNIEADLLLLDEITYSSSEINFFFYNTRNIQSPRIKAILNIILGNIYFNFNQPDSSISFYNNVIRDINIPNSSVKLKRLYIIALINKSKACFYLKDSLQALELLNKSIALSNRFGFKTILAKSNYYLSLFFFDSEPNKALELIREEILFYEKENRVYELINSKLLKASLLMKNNMTDSVLSELTSIYEIKNSNPFLKIKTLIEYGNFYSLVLKDSLAINYYTKSLNLAIEIGNYKLAHIAGAKLFLLYQHNKRYKEAFEFQKKNKAIKDTLRKQSSAEKLFLAKNSQQFLNKETAVSELEVQAIKNNLKIEQHKNNRQMLCLIFIFFLILLGIIIYFYVLTRNFNQKLLKNNSDLKSSNQELIKIQQKLEEQSKNKDRFFSIIAHDLRSPFNSVLGLSEYLSESMDELKKEDIIHFNELIFTSSKSLYNLLENLLDWSKAQIGKLEYNPQIVDLYEIAERELDVLRMLAKNKEIELVSSIEKGCFAYFDREMISTVIRNITNNAIKFTPKNGKVSLDIEVNNSELTLFIRDTGVGIPEENMATLFNAENYYTTYGTEGEKGTGLGLAICKEFVTKNMGSISIKSTENVGTEFKIKIPKTKREAEL